MRDYISRRQKVASKKNVRSALFFAILTISTILILIIFGIPLIVKYVSVLTNISKSNSEIESEDHTPPPPPTFQYFPDSTKEESVDIKGYTEPGAFVDLFINSDKHEIISDSDGNFSYKLEINRGSYAVEAISRDKSGNESKKIFGGKITFDNTPPEIEITNPSDNQQIYGSANKQLTISGKTDEESKLTVNGRSAIVSSDGSFSITFTLNEGDNTFNISSEDKAGNKSEKNITVNFAF